MARSLTLIIASLLLVTFIPGAHAAATASFTASVTDLSVAVDASGSTSDGTIVDYAYDFGDGSPVVSGSSPTASYTYATAGTYVITLTVTDDLAQTDTTTQSVTVTDPVIPNVAPTASLAVSQSDLSIVANGSASTDSDGTIVDYAFDFGDASPVVSGAYPTASYAYAAAGTYTVTLTVTDNSGATSTATQNVTVTDPVIPNVAPTASLAVGQSDLSIVANGSASSDSDGTISDYAFDFGDSSPVVSGLSPAASYTYATAGTYTVTLTVTDNSGATSTTTQSVTVTAPIPPNQAPTATLALTSHYKLHVGVSASGSDVDGTIASTSIDFGDATPAETTPTATHAYAAAGTYTITLTVTDDQGATGTATQSVTVVANVAPTASFTTAVSNSKVTVNAGASNDSDGQIASYAWSWGDASAPGAGKVANHTYAAAGTYTVTLTVTDNETATATVTKLVKILPQVVVSKTTYDLLPLGTNRHVAHYRVVLKITGGPVKGLVLTVSQAGTGGGGVGASKTFAGSLAPGTYTIDDLYQDSPGAATQVCSSASGSAGDGTHVETADGDCTGPGSILGHPVSIP